ncbi:MAG: transcriptional regulator, partial [Candidatus Neomarinimicrobiota bacterium]
MKVNIRKFEVYRYLDSEEMLQGHLEEAFNDGDPRLILLALDDIAKAKGMSKLAEKSG